jgi:beta-lactamase regulating signal transducer with metallopeptidase domain
MSIALTWLWQGLAVAGLTVLLLRLLPHLNAATRHAIWWAGLVAVLCIPLVLAVGAVRHLLPGVPPPSLRGGVQPALVLPPAPDWVGLLCASAWILTALCGFIRVVHGCCVVRALGRSSTPFDTARERQLPLWSQTRGHARRSTELRISEGLAGACALGFRRPVIVVGRTLVERLDDAALDQVVMHEYAHLERYDDWLQLFQAVARAVGGLHPAVCWLSRRIDLDREAACDDHVVARTGAAREYASALLEAAVAAGPRPTAIVSVPGATLRASALRRRVARLLDPARAAGTRATPMAAMGMLLPVLAILASPRVAPLVAFVDAVELALPVRSHAAEPHASVTDAISNLRTSPTAPAAGPVSGHAGPTGARAREGQKAPSQLKEPLMPPMPDSTSEPTIALPAVATVPIESRRLFERVDARLLSPARAAMINGLPSPVSPDRASGQARATSSLAGARGAASAVASGAERGGVAIGRGFARAGQAIAGKF